MMNLGLMKRFFDTVDAYWRSPLAEQIAACWVGPEAQVHILRASANFVCLVEQEGRKSFLRFNHESERQPAEIEAELLFIEHLAGQGVPAARPLPSRAGRLLETVPSAIGNFYAVLFEGLPGVEREFDRLDLAAFERWGQALGVLHRASQGCSVPGRPNWAGRLAQARQVIPAEESLVWREIETVAAALSRLPVGPADFGMIHYDFEQDNLCWQGDEPGSLDYDDCGPHWYAADIAYALRDLFHDSAAHIDLREPRLLSFVGGYRAVRAMPDAWLERLPLFLRLHNVVSFARITHALQGGALPGEPAWMPNLRQHLRGILDRYRADFEANPF